MSVYVEPLTYKILPSDHLLIKRVPWSSNWYATVFKPHETNFSTWSSDITVNYSIWSRTHIKCTKPKTAACISNCTEIVDGLVGMNLELKQGRVWKELYQKRSCSSRITSTTFKTNRIQLDNRKSNIRQWLQLRGNESLHKPPISAEFIQFKTYT